MNRGQALRLGTTTLLLGLLYGTFNSLTLGLTLPGSDAVVAVRPQVVIPILGGFVLGPVHGFFIGSAGNFLGDWLTGHGITYWTFSMGNGLIGLLPGLLPLLGVRRIDSVVHFALLLLLVVLGNALGIGLGMVGYRLVAIESLHQLTWTFFHPIIVANVILGFTLLPPLLLLLKRMSLTFDVRLGIILMYLLITVVLVLVTVLSLIVRSTILAGLVGTVPESTLVSFAEAAVLNGFRFGGSIGIVVILAGVGLTFALIQHQSRPVRALVQAARRLKEGRLDEIDLREQVEGRGEFSKLAQVFVEAVDQVREREASMARAIRELRLEIDRDQEARQVSEITETDYFQALRSRSQALRAKKEEKRRA